MYSKPLVSVLINNYNKEKHCLRAVKSILNQNYKRIEIIFYDDGSSDNSLNNIDRISKKNPKKIQIIKNNIRGKIYSFNQLNGIIRSYKKCKGKIICILDSDDFFKKNKIEKIVKYFQENKSCNLVFDLPIYYYNSNFQTKSKNNFLKRLNKWPKFPPTSCISLRKKGLKNILNKIKIKKFEEIWFDFRISTYFSFKKKEFNLIDDYLTFYNQDSDNFDKKYKKFVNKSWWIRRYQAFQFLKFLDEKKYKNNFLTLDYLATTTINKFF